jgi:hypothetical protein
MIRTPKQMLEHVNVPTAMVAPLANRTMHTPGLSNDDLEPRHRRSPLPLTSFRSSLMNEKTSTLVAVLGRATLIPGLATIPPPKIVTHVPAIQAPRRFPVASIDLSRPDVALPYGVPRYINAATLKVIAGGHRFDTLLKKTRTGWKFVEDDAMIDLKNSQQEYRLGKLTIFS